jgi:ABC-type dipeptide/oligopeptide/nickel transport system ATPase subunit
MSPPGTIQFEDTILSTVAVRQFPKSRYRKGIQLVFQDPTDSLNPRFTAYDTITEPHQTADGIAG